MDMERIGRGLIQNTIQEVAGSGKTEEIEESAFSETSQSQGCDLKLEALEYKVGLLTNWL
jgi:hypothetical protein